MAPLLHQIGGEGPPLLLIHGFGADRLGWAANTPVLMEKYSVWAAELPGHGEAPLGSVSVADMATNLLELLPKNDAPMAMIGHSLGGAVAAHLVMLAPERFSQLVLIAPAGYGNGPPDSAFLNGFAELKTEDEAMALLKRLVVRERLIQPAMAQHVLAHLAKPGRRKALSKMAQAAQSLDVPPLPQNALIVWGEDDIINLPNRDWLAGLGDQAMVLPGTGHLPHVEAATKVNRRMVEALSR